MDKIAKIKTELEKHIGKSNKITSKQIAEIIGIREDATQAKTRALILECAKQYKLPLAADNQGYYLITSERELNEYIKNLDSRIAGIKDRKRLIKENFKEKQKQWYLQYTTKNFFH